MSEVLLKLSDLVVGLDKVGGRYNQIMVFADDVEEVHALASGRQPEGLTGFIDRGDEYFRHEDSGCILELFEGGIARFHRGRLGRGPWRAGVPTVSAAAARDAAAKKKGVSWGPPLGMLSDLEGDATQNRIFMLRFVDRAWVPYDGALVGWAKLEFGSLVPAVRPKLQEPASTTSGLPDGWTVEQCSADNTPNIHDWGKWRWAGPNDLDGYAMSREYATAIVLAITENGLDNTPLIFKELEVMRGQWDKATSALDSLAGEYNVLLEKLKKAEMYRDIFDRQRSSCGDILDELTLSLWNVRCRFAKALGEKVEAPTTAIDSVAHILWLGDVAIAEIEKLKVWAR